MFITSSLFGTDRLYKRIEKLIFPYEKVIDFFDCLDSSGNIHDQDVYSFFTTSNLYQKKEIRKFHRILRIIKHVTYSKKSLYKHRKELELLINKLEKIQKFVVDYATTYYALITYYEIVSSYYYIDEDDEAVVNVIMQGFDKLGLQSMRGRGLYKFVKKIELDLRRLQALFFQNMISDELIVKINKIKTKLVIFKGKIIESSEYKKQLMKTRLLKAIGVSILFFAIIVPINIVLNEMLPVASSFVHPLIFRSSPVPIIGTVITIQEMNESTKYNIPVHSTSLFSWFRPFWPLTWIPRG